VAGSLARRRCAGLRRERDFGGGKVRSRGRRGRRPPNSSGRTARPAAGRGAGLHAGRADARGGQLSQDGQHGRTIPATVPPADGGARRHAGRADGFEFFPDFRSRGLGHLSWQLVEHRADERVQLLRRGPGRQGGVFGWHSGRVRSAGAGRTAAAGNERVVAFEKPVPVSSAVHGGANTCSRASRSQSPTRRPPRRSRGRDRETQRQVAVDFIAKQGGQEELVVATDTTNASPEGASCSTYTRAGCY